jgi:imidazole glycerol-phosphate synthase subunit HisF
MPLSKRIIPCLDVDNGLVVKGIHFSDVKAAGDPVKMAEKYTEQGADELVFLDITASQEGRRTMKGVVSNVANVVNIPFTVGGGIRNLEDAREILRSGADKVSINTAAVKNPALVTELMEIFGRQCVVVAIDAKCISPRHEIKGEKRNSLNSNGESDDRYEVMIYGGKKETHLDAIQWAREVEGLGAGEILLTSVDADGTEDGYRIDLTNLISNAVRIPVIASGGCGKPEHILRLFKETDADAALAASIFHYDKYTVDKVKSFLFASGITVRI